MKKKGKRLIVLGALCMAVFAFGMAAAACAPHPAENAQRQSASLEGANLEVAKNVAESIPENGVFPDNEFNSEYLHAGKRGCNACHDLYSKIDGMKLSGSNYQHIWSYPPGYGMQARIDDCQACHRLMRMRTGPNMAAVMHASHYNSDEFTEVWDGNCWSCHEIYRDQEAVMGMDDDHTRWMLWDEFKYSAAVGGFPVEDVNSDIPSTTVDWLDSRGWNGGHLTEMSLDSEMNMDVSFKQTASNEEDMYIVNNWGVIDGPASRTEIDLDEWTLALKGVNNPRSFTLEELQAMPQETQMLTQECYSIAPGTSLVGNFPVTGVRLSYLVDLCGGWEEGTDLFRATSHDSWDWTYGMEKWGMEPLVALKYWNHDLTENQGYPATLVVPGAAGAAWVKWVEQVEFSTTEVAKEQYGETNFAKLPMTDYEKFPNPLTCHWVCSSWFTPARDGQTFKLDSEGRVHLYGYTWSWYNEGHDLQTVKFSFDYGKTWKEFEVPADNDPFQWTEWDIEWEPPAPGTYVLKVSGVDASGIEQNWPASAILTVADDGTVTSSTDQSANGKEA